MGSVPLTLHEQPRLTLRYFNYEAFVVDREPGRCPQKTAGHYRHTPGSFASWLQETALESPREIAAHYIREYLLGLQHPGLKDTTQHAHARGIKTWFRWLVAEGDL
ncbi:MAG TPA: hypothetical protein VMW58_15240 [Anaerolineae bacterium]|nr:hypothetical protein [Anaerolineae bacterium]